MTPGANLLWMTALLAAACGPGHDDAADGDSDADADADSDADADADGVDCGGNDDLDVLVVEDHPPFTDMAPWADATVVVDCAAGRMRAMADGRGRAHFAGLDLANDPPDVSAFRAGGEMRTIAAVGFGGASVPQPFVVNLDSPHDTAERAEGDILRTQEGSELYCWCDGASPRSRHHVGLLGQRRGFLEDATRYSTPLFAELTDPIARAACLEVGEGAHGPRTLLAYAEVQLAGPGEGPPMTLVAVGDAEVERLDVTIRHLGGDADPFGAGRRVDAFVDDQDDDAFAVTIGLAESSERVGDLETFHLAWIPGASVGTPVLTLSLDASGSTLGWGVANVPIGEVTAEPLEIHAPPSLAAGVAEGRRTLHVTGADWADDLFVRMSRAGRGYWSAFVPGGLRDWRMPAPPDDGILPSGIEVSAWAYVYDETPPGDHALDRWWSLHLRELSTGPSADLPP